MSVSFAQISDLHFGALAEGRKEAALKIINAQKLDFVIVSGDITMRAKSGEYSQAKEFFTQFKAPLYIIPGNHDVPLHRFWERFLTPFARFEQYIGPTQVVTETDHFALVGLNTASPWLAANGRILGEDVKRIEELCSKKNANKLKIVVTHHPLTWILKRLQLQGLYTSYIDRILRCPVDLYVCGHYHLSRHSFTKEWFSNRVGFESMFFQAGTATSFRWRGEENAFYIYIYKRNHIAVQHWVWDIVASNFVQLDELSFQRDGGGWQLTLANSQ